MIKRESNFFMREYAVLNQERTKLKIHESIHKIPKRLPYREAERKSLPFIQYERDRPAFSDHTG
jgi:hypothetical protein